MSINRERLTWAAGRKASAPPATPGYETEDQDHPAHQPDPGVNDYENGDTSSWAEDPKAPPYPQGNPPSIPGYDTEDQDHPAHENPPRVPKEARSLREQIKVKASKCLKVARLMLGEFAPDGQIEDQALDLMDLPDDQLSATLNRCGGNPLVAEAEAVPEEDDDAPVTEAELDSLLAGDDFDDLGDEPLVEAGIDEVETPDEMETLACRMASLEKEIRRLRAGQNAPGGSQNNANASGKDEAAARAEGKATADKQEVKTAARKFFASMDTDGDGFVLKAEWLGSPAIFAAADKDKDDIVDEDEVVEAMVGGKKAADEEDEVVEEEVEEKEEKKASDDDDDDDEVEEKEVEEKEDEEVEAPAEKTACGEIDDAEMFGLIDDPMGLGESPSTTPEEDSLLASVFGKAAKDEEEVKEEEEVEVKDEDAEAQKKASRLAGRTASQKPQPRKASVGPKTIGSQVRVAKDEVGELSALWETAPDVSEVFGMK